VVVVGRGAVVVVATVAAGVVVAGAAGATAGSVDPAVDPAGLQAEANPMTSSRTTAFFTQAGYSGKEGGRR
jgi:hypothetical protein